MLPSQNARRDEDQQFAARIGHRVALEQPAEQRNPVQHRASGRSVDLLLADEDAADDRRGAVVDLHLGDGALRVDRAECR